jgi:hypothetical protein
MEWMAAAQGYSHSVEVARFSHALSPAAADPAFAKAPDGEPKPWRRLAWVASLPNPGRKAGWNCALSDFTQNDVSDVAQSLLGISSHCRGSPEDILNNRC